MTAILAPTNQHSLAPLQRQPTAAGESLGSATSLFPLPLAPFERLMLADDDPQYPMQFFFRLRFSGRLERAPLEKALEVALGRHPLLTAVVRQSEKAGPSWVAGEQPLPTVQWIEAEPAEALPTARHLDIRATPGLLVSAVVGETRSDLVAQVHHAACDAMGTFDFLGDLLTTYADIVTGGGRSRLKPLDPQRLCQRGAFGLTAGKLIKRAPGDMAALLRARRFYKRRPAPIVPLPRAKKDLPGDFPQSKFHRFDRAETAAIGRVAAAAETSVNSLLVRDLFLALGDWRSRQELADGDDWLRIAVPTNMRGVGDRRMPAANLVSLVFLDRQMSAVVDPDALLAGIRRETEAMKRDERGLRLLLALRLLQWFPSSMAKGVRRRRAWATALLTNAGPALPNCPLPRQESRLVAGDLTLEDVDFLPIVSRFQPVSFAVSTYAGKLTLGMHFDPRAVSATDAGATLGLYIRRIEQSISQ